MKKSVKYLIVLIIVGVWVWAVFTLTNPNFSPFAPRDLPQDDSNMVDNDDWTISTGDAMIQSGDTSWTTTGTVADTLGSGDVWEEDDAWGDDTVPFDPTTSTDPEVEEIINILEELIAEAEQE